MKVKTKLRKIKIAGWLSALSLLFSPAWLMAANNLILSPAKVEIGLKPGAQATRYLNLFNGTGHDVVFSVSVEDFSAAKDDSNTVVLGQAGGGDSGSLKNFIKVSPNPFVLPNGRGARIPVAVVLPKGVAPGGLYAAVLISSSPFRAAPASANIVTRLGALFFVKVAGSVRHSGILRSALFHDGKIRLAFENNGDIYLNPYGLISIYNSDSGQLAAKINIDPWFVLPGSTRSREVAISDLPAGNYTANLSMNRGYNDIVDKKNIAFSVGSRGQGEGTWVLLELFLLFLFSLLYKNNFHGK